MQRCVASDLFRLESPLGVLDQKPLNACDIALLGRVMELRPNHDRSAQTAPAALVGVHPCQLDKRCAARICRSEQAGATLRLRHAAKARGLLREPANTAGLSEIYTVWMLCLLSLPPSAVHRCAWTCPMVPSKILPQPATPFRPVRKSLCVAFVGCRRKRESAAARAASRPMRWTTSLWNLSCRMAKSRSERSRKTPVLRHLVEDAGRPRRTPRRSRC